MTTYTVNSGATSSGTTLNSGDTEYVSSGGTAVSTIVSSGGTLEDFGAVQSTVLAGGTLERVGAAAGDTNTTGSGTYIVEGGAGIVAVFNSFLGVDTNYILGISSIL